ncbi:MAG: hypothetical protein P8X90_01245 [Desulfobacterales bacterium]
MAKEEEIDIIDGQESENSPEEWIQRKDKIRHVLDERDFITPLDDVGYESMNFTQPPDSVEFDGPDEQEIELTFDGNDFPMDNDQLNAAEEPVSEDDVTAADEETEPSDPADAVPDENENPVEKDIHPDGTEKDSAVESAAPRTVNRPSMINKMIGFTLAVVVVAGYIFYSNPALVGLKKASEPTPPPGPEVVQAARPDAESIVKTPPPPSPHEKLTARLEEAADLRQQLLEKREEIDRLDLYFRNGIAELEEIIWREAKKEGINSFKQALQNKRIELNLRTIQRRRDYIQELEKPALWVDRGSEELLYLIRKAQLDLELLDIAGGIDLNKHNRHISAAINQYRLGTDKLAVHLQDEQTTSLETIWQQASKKRNATKSTGEPISLNATDERIASEICSGNLERIAELTSISIDTARCLSRMKGSELFLNAVTHLLPDAARELFQWQGNWICLNGVKTLSPAAGKYLFQWKGNWVSLNGLTEFQPELAVYLLKWEGQQLELMGLKYNKTEAEQKTLKYLALWETTGGKLFVPDEIRKEMGRIMLSQLQQK